MGMGMELRKVYKAAQDTFDEAAAVLKDFGWDRNLIDLCTNGPQELLNRTELAQPNCYRKYCFRKSIEFSRRNTRYCSWS